MHNPKIIFLDEPTIGLDVVAKQQIRTAIKTLNEEEGTTIFLTSHDAGDIESLCRRVIVINHGTIIFDDKTSKLRRDHLQRKVVEVRFGEQLKRPFSLTGVETLKQSSYGLKLAFDGGQIAVESVLEQIIATHPVNDITISDPPLEEVISEIYSQQ